MTRSSPVEPEPGARGAEVDVARLERLGAQAWPSATSDDIAGWRLCLDRGVTRRANTVLPLAWHPGQGLDAAIRAVETAFEERGLPACFKISAAARPRGLDHALARRFYHAGGASLVLTAPASAVPVSTPGSHPIELDERPGRDWAAACWPGADAAAAARLAIVSRIPSPRAFATARAGDLAVGAGLAAVAGDWAVLCALHTRPDHRRLGVGRSLVAALADWAVGRGARRLCLQVEADNRPALRLYGAAGFCFAYAYHYRMRARPGSGSG
ncbi:MAG: GNAT family N-acetyltransferase [Inquilinus sp.]|nr:GNAT family N-acetyltransferase [Inquilinus sp.]